METQHAPEENELTYVPIEPAALMTAEDLDKLVTLLTNLDNVAVYAKMALPVITVDE
jgi:hypothetical protein